MAGELIVRFLVGGAMVSLFALVGDLFKPKSFAGLFGAAPSVALATLALTLHKHGAAYGALEARSMIGGAAALFAYTSWVSRFLRRRRGRPPVVALVSVALWAAVAAAGWALFLRQP